MAAWVKTEPIGGLKLTENLTGSLSTATHQFRVYMDAPNAAEKDVLYHAGDTLLPLPGDAIPDTGLYPSQRECQQDRDDERIWIVTVNYQSVTNSSQIKTPDEATATKWRVEVSGSSVSYEEEVFQDKDGFAICNTNGEPIPGIKKIGYDQKVNVAYYTKSPDWASIDACLGKSNSAAVTLTIGNARMYATNTLKFADHNWSVSYDTDSSKIVRMELLFLYRKDTWQVKVPNMSFYKKVDGNLQRILDPTTNVPKDSPSYLGEDGSVLAVSDAIYRRPFDIVETASFSTLLSEVT